MTETIHIANTNVEFEYAASFSEPLEHSLSRHALCLQLQFLPLLYAQPSDIVAVTAMPDQAYFAALQQQIEWWPDGSPRLVLLHNVAPFQGKQCLSWGPSRQVQTWAEARQVNYPFPNWEVAQLINSKAFSFRYTRLPEAALLFSEQALFDWLQRTSGPKVLKTCFGLAGQGNWKIEEHTPLSEILPFCCKEWELKRPIIAEPWLDRVYDFSTQWLIHSDRRIELMGATRFEADAQGTYQGTLAGPQEILFASFEPFLQEHCQYVQKALIEIAQLGFFGFLGIDAFLYRDPHHQTMCLNPLVEINGRQTMSLVALRLQQRVCPKQTLRFAFQHLNHSSPSLLPNQLMNAKGKVVKFRRKLTAEIC